MSKATIRNPRRRTFFKSPIPEVGKEDPEEAGSDYSMSDAEQMAVSDGVAGNWVRKFILIWFFLKQYFEFSGYK